MILPPRPDIRSSPIVSRRAEMTKQAAHSFRLPKKPAARKHFSFNDSLSSLAQADWSQDLSDALQDETPASRNILRAATEEEQQKYQLCREKALEVAVKFTTCHSNDDKQEDKAKKTAEESSPASPKPDEWTIVVHFNTFRRHHSEALHCLQRLRSLSTLSRRLQMTEAFDVVASEYEVLVEAIQACKPASVSMLTSFAEIAPELKRQSMNQRLEQLIAVIPNRRRTKRTGGTAQ